MNEYITPLLLLAALFVAFGLFHRQGKGSRPCVGCTGCSDKSECSNEK